MKRNSFSVFFFIKKTKLLSNGEAPIRLRIKVNGVAVESQIKRSISPNLWDQATESSKGRDRKASELNEYIRMMKLKALTIHRDLEMSGKLFTARLIMNALYNADDDKRTLLGVFRKHNDDCRKLIGIDYVKITITRFDNCCKYLGVLIQRKFGKEDINLNEIDAEFVRDFEMYLKVDRGCQQNTVIRYMKCFKKIINLAIANEWMTRNPFAGIKFQAKEVIKEILTKEEIERIMIKDFEMEHLEYVRDVFTFCIFTGLAYTDVNNLRAEHLTTDNNGDVWIRKAREKTENMCNIPLLKIPQMILEKYKDHPIREKTGALLPVTSNQKMNSYLKEIATRCNIKKTLTTHSARYTYASVVCLANGVSMENVAKMLGHSDIRMTQHYAKVMDSSIKRDMAGIDNCFADMVIV
ncbi:site-specific integrase [Dysgonomonas sp. ZJ279]|uniref:site-specific integrase n=1 Tax=Dysgonomonas sp. ZJ279 TaxID=2709796 RepID=UPI0013EA1375|nr:site-specific integrase [Dysgonomonas sp. ZJ279]